MDLFWKRAKEHDDLDLTPDTAPVSIDRQSVNYLATPAEALDPNSKRPEGARNPKSELVFADEAEIHALAEQPEQIDVESLVDRITDRKSQPRRGLLYWMWIASAPLFGLWLIAMLLSANLWWAPVCLFALATARVFSVQSARQEQDRAALQNAHLDNRWLGPLCEALEARGLPPLR